MKGAVKLPGLILISTNEEEWGYKYPTIKPLKEYIEAQFIQGVAKIAFSQSGIPNTFFVREDILLWELFVHMVIAFLKVLNHI